MGVYIDSSASGINVIINNRFGGLIFRDEIFTNLQPGMRVKGYIKNVREDNKIDVSLRRQGYAGIPEVAQKILDVLEKNGGYLDLTDKSNPAEITARLKMSKKTFKKAIGGLYKRRIVRLEKDGIYLN